MAVNVIGTIKPKNNGDFPVAEAVDIAVSSSQRLPEALADKADLSALAATNETVASKASIADMQTATANLQGQINQIEISATAEAVVAPEVAAARVDTNGIEYNTLKTRLDANETNGNNDIVELGLKSFHGAGGTGESWTTFSQEISQQAVYEIVIDPFTARESLTGGYVIYEIYEYYSDNTNRRIAVSTKTNYDNKKVTVVSDNRAGNIIRIDIKTRPEQNTEVSAHIKNITDSADLALAKNDINDLETTFRGIGVFSDHDIGGTGESWCTFDFAISNKNYMLTIDPITPRSSLSTTYTLYQVIVTRSGGATTTIVQKNIASYDGQPVNILIENVNDTITTITVKTRPETNTTSRVVVEDVTSEYATAKLESQMSAIEPYFNKKSYSTDFSDKTIGSTYVGESFNVNIPDGATITLEIASDESDEQTTYFNLYGNGTRLNSSAFFSGVGTRSRQFTNEYGVAIDRIDLVLVRLDVYTEYTLTILQGEYLPAEIERLDRSVNSLQPLLVPEYFNSQLSSAISTARLNIAAAGRDGESFVFITDVHWSGNAKHSPALINEITNNLPINTTVFGGDVINGGEYSVQIGLMNDFAHKMAKASRNFIGLFGNHDLNALDGGTSFTNNEYYSMVQKYGDYVVNFGNNDYYYYDNPTTKTRYICLDSYMGNGRSVESQTAWLEALLAATESDWHILIFVHVIYITSSDYQSKTISTFMQGIITLLDAQNATTGRAKVEAIIAGHNHADYNTETAGGIPIILTDCDARQTESGNPQALGTIGEQAFDIMTINYKTKTINCVRLGRGSNRTISYGEE